MTLSSKQQIAESIVGEVTWKDEYLGYCRCPGIHEHTCPNGLKACRVTLDRTPTIHCVHESCREEVEESNRMLRQGIPGDFKPLGTAERKAYAKKKRDEEDLRRLSANQLGAILQEYPWPYREIITSSPWATYDAQRADIQRAFLSLFDREDIVWVGEKHQSGAQWGDRFKTVAEWVQKILEGNIPSGPLTCPSTFNPGNFKRGKDNIARTPYLVVESDSLKKDEIGAIFRWLDSKGTLTLRAIVDTAGKSLHGWFEYPDDKTLDQLKIILPAMGCDPKLFSESQPVRMPGGLREGEIQRLIYFSPDASNN